MMTTTLRRLSMALALVLLCAPLAWASNYAVDEIPDAIPAADAARLKAAGVPTTFALLQRASDARIRKALAVEIKISEKTLEGWVQMADLLRVKGIGPDVARLLAAAGIHTVDQLKNASSAKLNEEIGKVNSKEQLSKNPPSEAHLQAWIAQAKTLPIVLK